MTDFVKINGIWHIKDADSYIGNKALVTLHCTGTTAQKGRPESKDAPGDTDPVCEKCLHDPLPDAIKEKNKNNRLG